MIQRCLALIVGLSLLAGCRDSTRTGIAVSAAASTREAIERLAANFKKDTGIAVEVNFGPSSTLAKQIEEGGPADIFLSADENWADYLEKAGLVEARRDLLGNRLVVVVPATKVQGRETINQLADLAGSAVKHLGLAGAGVPAGEYARAALRKAGIWERIKRRVISGRDVRGTLAFVEQGEVEAGIVYATDAAVSQRVQIALEIPEKLYPPIRYPLVLVRRQARNDISGTEARRFYDFLSSSAAAAVFRAAGFKTFAKD